MNKFNYKSSIISISTIKYLLTIFMDDARVTGSYLQSVIKHYCMVMFWYKRKQPADD